MKTYYVLADSTLRRCCAVYAKGWLSARMFMSLEQARLAQPRFYDSKVFKLKVSRKWLYDVIEVKS